MAQNNTMFNQYSLPYIFHKQVNLVDYASPVEHIILAYGYILFSL